MPRLDELTKKPDMSRFQDETAPLSTLMPGDSVQSRGTNLPTDPVTPASPVNQRCPLPALGTPNADSLRQFYKAGVPQFRVFSK